MKKTICEHCGREQVQAEMHPDVPSLKSIPYGSTECRILISAYKDTENHDKIRPRVSFVYFSHGGIAAEWNVQDDIICIYYDVATHGLDVAQRRFSNHYIYGDTQMDDSFAAVAEEELVEKFTKSDYTGIFESLKKYAER